jgi:hypothetical protein
MPQMNRKHPERKYVIHDEAGLELGESAGPTKATALVRLYRLGGLTISPDKAEEMILDRRVSFTVVA